MPAFKSIDELLRVLYRERQLLGEVFQKRKSMSFRFDYAMELVDYKEQRIQLLIDEGVLRESGNFIELEDIYLRFFEDVLQVNEEINISAISDYITSLNENIDYYLKESNDRRKGEYLRAVRRVLKTIALSTVRNVIDLKRNVENTYKNEPNYLIKKQKLQNLDAKRNAIAQLIKECEDTISNRQPTFFRVAMDVSMRTTVIDVQYQLNESYHNLIEIDRQIINYLGQIEYQNRLIKKLRQLKYLRDQVIIEEYTNVRERAAAVNPVWMEPRPAYPLKLSISELQNNDDCLEIIHKVISAFKLGGKKRRQEAGPIASDFLESEKQVIEVVDQNAVFNAFVPQSTDLYHFVFAYHYNKEMTREDKLVLFCQIASQYASQLRFTPGSGTDGNITFPIIYAL